MKPLSLTLKNFGPYINETIDFTKFEDSSLFLISGKTGSGKTTIFDGMSYALFGESSGKLRLGKEMRSTFADPSEATEVTLLFKHNEFLYELNRLPEQELFKKRGTGVRKQSAKISLIVKDAQGKELRAYSKRREVDELIQELLHLNANQFAQIVLLPQGEFRTFLIAKSDEKEKVLRNLFGTELYQLFSENLKERLKIANQEIQETQQKIELKTEQLHWSEEPEPTMTLFEKLQLLESQQQEAQQQLLVEREQITTLKQAKQAKEQVRYAIEERQNLQQQKEELLEKKTKQAEQETVIERLKEQIQQLKWSQKQQSLAEKVFEKRSEKQQKEQETKSKQQALMETQQALTDWQAILSELEEQQPLIAEKQERLQTIQRQLPQYQEYEQLAQQQIAEQANYQAIQKEYESCQQEKITLADKVATAKQFIEQEGTLEKANFECSSVADHWQNFVERWQKNQKAWQKISQNQVELHELTQRFAVEQQQKSAEEAKLQTKKSQWASLQIQRLSLLLEEGEPCPVCGSLEHPKQQTHQEVSLEEINQAERELTEVEKTVQRFTETLSALRAEKQQKESQLQEQEAAYTEEQEQLAAQFADLQLPLTGLTFSQVTPAEIAEVESQLAKEKQQIAQKLTEISVEKDRLAELEEQVAENSQRFEVLRQQVETMQQSLERITIQQQMIASQLLDATVTYEEMTKQQALLQEELSAFERQKENVTTQGETLKKEEMILESTLTHLEKEQQTLQQTVAQLESQLNAVLTEQGVTEDQLTEWLKEVPTLESQQEQIALFEQEQTQLTIQLAEIEKKLSSDTFPELSLITTEIEQITQQIEEQEKKYYQLHEKMLNNQQLVQEINAQRTTIEDKFEEVAALQQLADTVNGNNPKKISFERYMLQTYLERVLTVANQRLDRLTNSRYQFELNHEAGSYRNQTGLEINIYDDNSGTVRSAHTLSGGESFIAALALALSLAEVIQEQAGGVLIDALFIDEGFGSLDEEALEMAMEALETIENEGRMIGIISHIGELKARIPQQLQIKSNGNGQSTVHYQLA